MPTYFKCPEIRPICDSSVIHGFPPRPGDIVTAINGQPVHGSRDVYKLLEGGASPLILTVSRNRERDRDIAVTPEPPQ
jgi:S1-C subfamily serine protease